MWLAKQLTTRSLPDIGRRFGGRDHTTVLHAVRRIEELRAGDPQLARDLETLSRKLRGGYLVRGSRRAYGAPHHDEDVEAQPVVILRSPQGGVSKDADQAAVYARGATPLAAKKASRRDQPSLASAST